PGAARPVGSSMAAGCAWRTGARCRARRPLARDWPAGGYAGRRRWSRPGPRDGPGAPAVRSAGGQYPKMRGPLLPRESLSWVRDGRFAVAASSNCVFLIRATSSGMARVDVLHGRLCQQRTIVGMTGGNGGYEDAGMVAQVDSFEDLAREPRGTAEQQR